MTDPGDGGTATGYPWRTIGEDASREQSSPTSPFNGAQRDYYLASTTVDNARGPKVWYSDPYGEDAGRTAFHGSVRQLVSNSNTTSYPEAERSNSRLNDDYARPDLGVHAPN